MTRDPLHVLVEKFWELEHIGIKDHISSPGMSKNSPRPPEEWSPQETAVDAKMPVVRDDKGNFYVCSIPWKTNPPNLRNNLNEVKNRQENVNDPQKLLKKKTSIEALDEIFLSQIKKGYIEEITDPEDVLRPDCNYIPYFPVVREERSSTKVRIVFDAAARNKEKISLNSQIEKGPNRLQDLFGILLRFRQYDIALTADISEMFLQCRLAEPDRKYHRFYWNKRFWQWVRILFGNLASPDISQKVLSENAKLFKAEFPLAAQAVLEAMYMDDILKSVETASEAIQLARELPPLHMKCGMKICKFECNDISVMKTIPKEIHSTKVDLEKETGSVFDTTRVLGILWNANTDQFQFKCKFTNLDDFLKSQNIDKEQFKGWTKSLILRFAATVYDPLGLISPFTVRSRKILQKLWQENLTWTDVIPKIHQDKWDEWLNELFTDAVKIQIPRSFSFGKHKNCTLHVFVDASTEAYAATVFVRVEDPRGEKESKSSIESHLVTAKARVTPTKAESVSRLELNSAVIGHRLGYAVAVAYCMDPLQIRFWTDSMNVLYWINTPANRIRTFVSNRVGQIQAHSKTKQWRHVPTDQNPADIATRDISISDMVDNTMWLKGPAFLQHEEPDWPPEFKVPSEPNDETKSELKKLFSTDASSIFALFAIEDPGEIDPRLDPSQFSIGRVWDGYKKLLNITTRVFEAFRQKQNLSPKELEKQAISYLARKTQREDPDLQTVIEQLTDNEPLSTHKEFKPFLDEQGVLRSESRLSFSKDIPYDIRFPIMLSKRSALSKLIAESAHDQYEHPVGRQMAKNKVRENFCIIGIDNLLREIKAGCLYCIRMFRKPLEQQMAAIPQYRFEHPLQAFSRTGLDFAGPFHIKQGRGKLRLKSYILVLTCLQTRAVHLEATHDQSTNSVLNAFSRFIDLRGMPQEFLSDNWKSFTSPEKELEAWVQDLDEELIVRQKFAQIYWHFTPPYGPHHGGIYETMVKATKRALKSLFTEEDLNMDEFRTAISRVASLLNSRPLTKVQEENTSQILTPNHFLFGKLGGAVSTEDLDHPVERWKRVHALVNKFWKQFLLEYIPLLARRSKWHTVKENLQVGEVVLQLDPNTPRGQWKLAVVEEVFPNADGLVRKCKIRTTTGTYERPITKLVSLEYRTFETQG